MTARHQPPGGLVNFLHRHGGAELLPQRQQVFFAQNGMVLTHGVFEVISDAIGVGLVGFFQQAREGGGERGALVVQFLLQHTVGEQAVGLLGEGCEHVFFLSQLAAVGGHHVQAELLKPPPPHLGLGVCKRRVLAQGAFLQAFRENVHGQVLSRGAAVFLNGFENGRGLYPHQRHAALGDFPVVNQRVKSLLINGGFVEGQGGGFAVALRGLGQGFMH